MNTDRFKYRVYDPDNRRMIYIADTLNDFVSDQMKHNDTNIIREILFNHWMNINLDEQVHLMQCTGLRDAKRKLLWESDIVDWYLYGSKEPRQAVVQWDGWRFSAPIRSIPADEEEARGPNLFSSRLIVTGNIYENPETLKKYVGVDYEANKSS